jgi:hypothetical protein
MTRIKLKSEVFLEVESITLSDNVLSFTVRTDYDALKPALTEDALSEIRIFNTNKLTAVYENYTSLQPFSIADDLVTVSLKQKQNDDRTINILSTLYKKRYIDDVCLFIMETQSMITTEEKNLIKAVMK